MLHRAKHLGGFLNYILDIWGIVQCFINNIAQVFEFRCKFEENILVDDDIGLFVRLGWLFWPANVHRLRFRTTIL